MQTNLRERLDRHISTFVKEVPNDQGKQNVLSNMFKLKDTHSFYDFEQLASELKNFKANKLSGKTIFNFNEIVSPVWNREKIVVQLDLLDMMLEKVRGPPPILIVGKSGEASRSFGIERIQTEWWKNSGLRQNVHDFGKSMADALFEYNKQLFLLMLSDCVTDLSFWMSMTGYSQSIDRKEFLDVFNALESQYYMEGNHMTGIASGKYHSLEEDEFGKLFLITNDEMKKALEMRMRR